MNHEIIIPEAVMRRARAHLFQNELEQGAFFFASTQEGPAGVQLQVSDCYLVPPTGWDVQLDIYLQMNDAERGRILKLARDRGCVLIDSHSHPGAGSDVWFSPSDLAGISDFAPYVRWKLGPKPFAALVWGEDSVDGVVWPGNTSFPQALTRIVINGANNQELRPTGSWFSTRPAWNRYEHTHE